MPLGIDSITRASGAGCNHYNVVFNLDGNTSSATLSRDDVTKLMDSLSPLPGNYKHLLLVLLVRYRLEQGVSLANLAAACSIS